MIDSYIINLSICIIEFDSFQNIDLMQFYFKALYLLPKYSARKRSIYKRWPISSNHFKSSFQITHKYDVWLYSLLCFSLIISEGTANTNSKINNINAKWGISSRKYHLKFQSNIIFAYLTIYLLNNKITHIHTKTSKILVISFMYSPL